MRAQVLGWPLAAAAWLAVGTAGAPRPGPFRDLRAIESPAPPGSGQPFLSSSASGRVGLSWLEAAPSAGSDKGGHRLRYAEYDGSRWSAPVTAAEGVRLFVNWADVPSVVRLTSGRLAAHFLDRSGPGTYDYDVKVRMSDPSGERWGEIVTPHRDGVKAEHGFASLFDWPGDRLALVWLDGRNFDRSVPGVHGGGAPAPGALPPTPDMTLRAASVGPDGTIADEALLDGRVCECCPTAATRTANGVVVAYRDRSDQEVRDIHVVRYEDGAWTPPSPVWRDNWRIFGCPVNGPALASHGHDVAIAWFAAPDADPRVAVAFSRDGGATWSPPTRVEDGVPLGRVALTMLDDGSALVGWIETNAGRTDFRARRVAPNGERSPSAPITGVSGDRRSGYPRMVRSGREVYFAWTATDGQPRVLTAVARVD